MITGKTKITGIFGYPIEHTLSPIIHNTAYEYLGLNYIYLPFLVRPEDLKHALKSIKIFGICGVNLTIPHKESCLPYLDFVDPEAGIIGAVNTIKFEKDKLLGYNTDGKGFISSLKNETSFKTRGKVVFVLGSGGAARAIIYVLAKEKADRIIIANRTISRAERLVKEMKGKFPSCKMEAISYNSKYFKNYMDESNLLVNTTSVGLNPNDGLLIDSAFLHSKLIVYDLIYSPFGTRLILEAKKRKLEAIDGLGMLVYQAALSFEIWTGKKAPVKIIQCAIKNHVKRGQPR